MIGCSFKCKKMRCGSGNTTAFFRTNVTIIFSKWINGANAFSELYQFIVDYQFYLLFFFFWQFFVNSRFFSTGCSTTHNTFLPPYEALICPAGEGGPVWNLGHSSCFTHFLGNYNSHQISKAQEHTCLPPTSPFIKPSQASLFPF